MQEWIDNLIKARTLMQTIPEEKIALDWWQNGDRDSWERHDTPVVQVPDCGTIACFGGWIALSPLFPQVQVATLADEPYDPGEPIMRNDRKGPYASLFSPATHSGTDVAVRLFGDTNMFCAARSHEPGTNKQIVLARIAKRLKELGHAD